MTETTDQEDDPGAAPMPPDQAIGTESGGLVDPKQVGVDQESTVALLIRVKVPDQPGVLHALTEVISHDCANITYVGVANLRADHPATYVELTHVGNPDGLLR